MKKLCIICPAVGKYSTTFITNQINELPFQKYILTRENGDLEDLKGEKILSSNIIARLIRFVRQRLTKYNFSKIQNKALAKYLKKNRIDHVLFQFGTLANDFYPACLYAKVEFTVHFHGYDAYKNNYDENYYMNLFKYAKNIVAVSHHMQDKLVKTGAPINKVQIIPYGSNFTINNKERIRNSKEIRYLAVGRFVEKKAPYLTILAFAKALNENKNIVLYMAGEGELLIHCKNIVKALKIENKVNFLGALSHIEIRNEMCKSDFFIQHSIVSHDGDSEGLPNSIIEALTLNIPVISTEHTGIPEIVKHEKNGLLCDEKDVDNMAKNILRAIKMKFDFQKSSVSHLDQSIRKLTNLINS